MRLWRFSWKFLQRNRNEIILCLLTCLRLFFYLSFFLNISFSCDVSFLYVLFGFIFVFAFEKHERRSFVFFLFLLVFWCLSCLLLLSLLWFPPPSLCSGCVVICEFPLICAVGWRCLHIRRTARHLFFPSLCACSSLSVLMLDIVLRFHVLLFCLLSLLLVSLICAVSWRCLQRNGDVIILFLAHFSSSVLCAV